MPRTEAYIAIAKSSLFYILARWLASSEFVRVQGLTFNLLARSVFVLVKVSHGSVQKLPIKE